jgi:hypothetical protein
MPLTFVNRRQQTYYLIEGKTKTGKPKYHASRKPTGNLLDQMPAGFEFYEEPERSLVTVRKVAPSKIRSEEREQLIAWTRELAASRSGATGSWGTSWFADGRAHGRSRPTRSGSTASTGRPRACCSGSREASARWCRSSPAS